MWNIYLIVKTSLYKILQQQLVAFFRLNSSKVQNTCICPLFSFLTFKNFLQISDYQTILIALKYFITIVIHGISGFISLTGHKFIISTNLMTIFFYIYDRNYNLNSHTSIFWRSRGSNTRPHRGVGHFRKGDYHWTECPSGNQSV